jgi:hypothetical protein
VPGGCSCNAGYSGSVTVSASSPFYTGSCAAVSCPAYSSGTNVPGGCACNSGYTGSIQDSASNPFYAGSCAQDCVEGAWSTWSGCSSTCGTGTLTRTRTLQQPQVGGAACGDAVESQSCNAPACPVNCVEASWSSWGACSVTCGGGSQSRSRVSQQPQHGGTACGPSSESQQCGASPCPSAGVVFAMGGSGVYQCTSDTSCSQLFSPPSGCSSVMNVGFDSSNNLVLRCQAGWTSQSIWRCTGLSTPCTEKVDSTTLCGSISGVTYMRVASINGADYSITTHGHDNMVRKCPLDGGGACTAIAGGSEFWQLQVSSDGTQGHVSRGHCTPRNIYSFSLTASKSPNSGGYTNTCSLSDVSEVSMTAPSGSSLSGGWILDSNSYSSSGSFYCSTMNGGSTSSSRKIYSCPANGGSCSEVFALGDQCSSLGGTCTWWFREILFDGTDFLARDGNPSKIYRCSPSSGTCSVAFSSGLSVGSVQQMAVSP